MMNQLTGTLRNISRHRDHCLNVKESDIRSMMHFMVSKNSKFKLRVDKHKLVSLDTGHEIDLNANIWYTIVSNIGACLANYIKYPKLAAILHNLNGQGLIMDQNRQKILYH